MRQTATLSLSMFSFSCHVSVIMPLQALDRQPWRLEHGKPQYHVKSHSLINMHYLLSGDKKTLDQIISMQTMWKHRFFHASGFYGCDRLLRGRQNRIQSLDASGGHGLNLLIPHMRSDTRLYYRRE